MLIFVMIAVVCWALAFYFRHQLTAGMQNIMVGAGIIMLMGAGIIMLMFLFVVPENFILDWQAAPFPILLSIVLLYIGHRTLPWLGEWLGKATRRFKKAHKHPHAIFEQERPEPIEKQEGKDTDTTKSSQMGESSIAEYWKRGCALIVDVIILFLVFITLDKIINTNNVVYYLIIFWLYFSISESSNLKATFGKELLNISVVDLSGKQITFLKATVRFCFKILPILIILIIKTVFKGQLGVVGNFVLWFLLLGCYPFFDENSRFLHDRIAGTIVTNKLFEADKEGKIDDTEGVSEQGRPGPIEKQEEREQ